MFGVITLENLFWIFLSTGIASYYLGIAIGVLVMFLWFIAHLYSKNQALKMSLKIRPRYFIKPYPESQDDKCIDSYEFHLNEAAIHITRQKYIVFCYMKKMSIFREVPKHDLNTEGGYEVFVDEWFKEAESIYFSTFNDLKGTLKPYWKAELRRVCKASLPARKYYLNIFNQHKKQWISANSKFPADYKILYWLEPDYTP